MTLDRATGTATAELPASDYTDPERYAIEREAIFAREWTAICARSDLATDGAYRSVWIAGYPILVVNDRGRLRAFQNVCRHRAGPLVDDASGICSRLVCRYHGWAYNLDGSLASARDFGAEVSRDSYSLIPASVSEWRGLVFVNLDPGAPDLTGWLGAVVHHSQDFAMETFQVTHRSSHDITANWKVYAENYQEGYHIPLVHPGLNRQIDASRYQVEVDGAVTVHRAPTRAGAVTDGAWLWRFPGLAINLYPSGMCLESFWPTGPTTTRIEYTFSFAPGTAAAEVDAAVASSMAILDEDRTICETVQRNLTSGLARPGLLSPKHEAGVALVRTMVRSRVADAQGSQ